MGVDACTCTFKCTHMCIVSVEVRGLTTSGVIPQQLCMLFVAGFLSGLELAEETRPVSLRDLLGSASPVLGLHTIDAWLC